MATAISRITVFQDNERFIPSTPFGFRPVLWA